MQGTHWWLVCYDVRDAKRLRRAAQHMEGYGERMQYSIFRCWLTPNQVQGLRWEMTELLEAEDDVLFIPLCARCVTQIQGTHSAAKTPSWPDKPEGHRVL
jgi:CRISPR-associated protein Cas2